jgi:cell shape-determining protein MreD
MKLTLYIVSYFLCAFIMLLCQCASNAKRDKPMDWKDLIPALLWPLILVAILFVIIGRIPEKLRLRIKKRIKK